MQTTITRIEIKHDAGETRFGHSDFKFTRVYAELADGEKIQVHSISKVGASGETSAKWAKLHIEKFNKTDRKCFEDYCRGENETHDVLGFMEWVDENGYHYDEERTSLNGILSEYRAQEAIEGVWEFHGNLHEYSGAFSFYIFDEELKETINFRFGVNKLDYERIQNLQEANTGQE